MGRPGGFFKKLKAKQKRSSSRQQRGTKGASKEDRRRKHNERVELYAAKREAEQLAVVSSSSDDEVSTDSEAGEKQQTASLRKLHRLLGVAGASATSRSRAATAPGTAAAQRQRRRGRGTDGETDETALQHADRVDSDFCDDDSAAARFGVRAQEDRRRRRGPRHETTTTTGHGANGHALRRAAAAGAEADDDVDGEDWRLYLGDASSAGSESGDGASQLDDEEGVEELGEETDDADDVVDTDLLMDLDDDEEDEDDEDEVDFGGDGGAADGDGSSSSVDGGRTGNNNPLFDLDHDSDDEDEDDDGADLFDEAGMLYDAGERGEEDEDDDEEGEEEEREDAFVDDEDADDASSGEDDKRKGEAAASQPSPSSSAAAQERLLLQQFRLSTSTIATLQRYSKAGTSSTAAAAAAPASSVVLTEKDEWMRKYHLDLHGAVDETPLQPVPVPHAAVELLGTSNEPLIARAAQRLETTVDKELGLFFVSPEEYATLHPDNVAVLATAHAQRHLLHAPFDVAAASTPSSSRVQAKPAESWTQCPSYVHPALWEKWVAFRAARQLPTFTVEERGLLDLLQGYADVLDTLHSWQNSASRREVYVLHLLNHWFKARSVVLAHDAMLAKRKEERRRKRQQQQQEQQRRRRQLQRAKAGHVAADDDDEGEKGGGAAETRQTTAGRRGTAKAQRKVAMMATNAAEEGEDEDEEDEELELRDRGFSKTRLCVLCPLRNHAYKLVHTLVSILQADPAACPKLAMFEQDFTEIEEAVDPTFRRRPRDYQRAFEGNIDDSFCVGLRLEPERVHVYAHPLNSDVIICSPLGLRRRLEKNGDVLVSLSSIEVCLLEEAQMLFQQNWMHVTAVLELLNKRPTDTTHGLSDLRRVYAWALEGKSGRHRQTIITTDVCNATMLSTFRTSSVNNSGKLLLQRRADPGVLSRVLVPVRQHFIRFEPSSLASVDDDRFAFFTKQMYEAKLNAMAERDVRIIIFVPSYFDFVRVRNYLHREYRESYVALSEYTSLKQQRKALGQFSDLERPVLLVTERFYYFKRYFVKLAEALVFYSPPMFPEYYASLTNRLVATSPNAFTMTLYCRYDTHELNRLVGTSRMVQLLERDSGVFSFVTS